MLNGRLYVMGGDGCNKLQVLEMSEENEFTWTVKADMPTAQYDAASAVVDGKLWVMCGSIDDDETDNVAIYDPANDTWVEGPPLPQATRDCTAATLDGVIHVAAGYGLSFVYRDAAWVEEEDVHEFDLPPTRASLLLG